MKIELSKIPNTGLEIDAEVVLDRKLYEKANIDAIPKLTIKGLVNYDYENHLTIDLTAEGVFLLKDALTLEPIEYPFSCVIEENIADIEDFCGDFFEKSKNTLDISEILWENIVLEIPISASKGEKKNLSLKGEGWELVDEKVEKIDPRLAKLQELLYEGKD